MLRAAGIIVGVFVLFILIMAATPIIADLTHDEQATAVSENDSCATGAGTSCSVTLDNAHIHAGTTHMTVTETSPGSSDRTATSSLSNVDRTTLTISSLTTATTYNFTIAYERRNSNITAQVNDMLSIFPAGFFFGFFVLIGIAVVMAFVWIKRHMEGSA